MGCVRSCMLTVVIHFTNSGILLFGECNGGQRGRDAKVWVRRVTILFQTRKLVGEAALDVRDQLGHSFGFGSNEV